MVLVVCQSLGSGGSDCGEPRQPGAVSAPLALPGGPAAGHNPPGGSQRPSALRACSLADRVLCRSQDQVRRKLLARNVASGRFTTVVLVGTPTRLTRAHSSARRWHQELNGVTARIVCNNTHA